MINSILNRHTDPVHFDNIKLENDIITDSPTIKEYIQSHFCQWTAHNPYNQSIFQIASNQSIDLLQLFYLPGMI